MNCKTCGTWLTDGAMFCGECGSSVLAASALSDTQRFERNPNLRNSGGPAFGATPGVQPVQPVQPAHPVQPAYPTTERLEQIVSPPSAPTAPSGPIATPDQAVPVAPVAAPASGDAQAVPVVDPTPATHQAVPPLPPIPGFSTDAAASEREQDAAAPDVSVQPPAQPTPPAQTGPSSLGDRPSTTLAFSTGETVAVDGSGLVGRNPMARDGEGRRQIVRIVDPGLTVSKTHLEFGFDGGQFWISDRQSGNGTVIETAAGSIDAIPGVRYGVLTGTRVYLGQQFFDVR